MAIDFKVERNVFDAHSHLGELEPYPFYGLDEPVKPTVFDYATADDYQSKHMDPHHVDRSVIMANYGNPDPSLPFSFNDLVVNSIDGSDRLRGAIWVSGVPRDQEHTQEALELAGENNVKALKATSLLGGTYDPEEWDEETEQQWDLITDTAIENGLILHLHTTPGGGSDISGAIKLVEKYGKDLKTHFVHMGGGVSGHIKIVPRFLDMIEEGYQVYTDCSWAKGFGPRFLLSEIERRGVGADNVLFASDTPWGDFWSEYWKIEGANVSSELKDKVFWENAQRLYS